MNEIWANRLIDGDYTWGDVPPSRKNAVKEVLRDRAANGVIAPELYEQITGEEYPE